MNVKTGKLENVCPGDMLHIGEWISLSRLYAEAETWDWSEYSFEDFRGPVVESRIKDELEKRHLDPSHFYVTVCHGPAPKGPLPTNWRPSDWVIEVRLLDLTTPEG